MENNVGLLVVMDVIQVTGQIAKSLCSQLKLFVGF